MNPIFAYLTQPSTLRGVVNLLVSAGLLHLTPETQDQIVAAALLIIAAGQAVVGVINVLHDEKKA